LHIHSTATRWFRLGQATWTRYSEHGDLLAAAISFYALLSVAPLAVIAVGVAGAAFGRSEARAQLISGLRSATNADVAQTMNTLLDAAQKTGAKLAAVIALVMLFWAASRFFLQIQEAINLIWGVRVSQSSRRELIRRLALKRLLSFAMVLGCGALLLGTLALHAVLAALQNAMAHLIALPAPLVALQDLLVTWGLLTALFAGIYRMLPDVSIRWADVWVGAALTALLMLLGTWLLGLYLGRIAPSWLQGAIGSLAVFMVWTNYLTQIFLFGVAFTRTWSCRHGEAVAPEPHAELVPDRASPRG